MIFGTDGLRATVGETPLSGPTIVRLSQVLREDLGHGARVVIGRDTRSSCNQLFQWITQQFSGISVLDLGVVPTAAVAYETRQHKAKLGIMITASHNPSSDNGYKFFDKTGLKIKYTQAQNWSDRVLAMEETPLPNPPNPIVQAPNGYRSLIRDQFKPEHFKGLRVAFDFAHGATTGIGEELITGLMPGAIFMGDFPNGTNINAGVGALHPEALTEVVQSKNLDIGFAFDGDGDRLVVVDADGVCHGDVLLYALKQVMVAEGLALNDVVGTILCGLGLEERLAEEDIRLHRTPVGDQNVLARMVEGKFHLGGEPSGHLIQADLFPAGDGLLAALRLARALRGNRGLLKQARERVPLYPVFEKAYPVRHKPSLDSLAPVQDALAQIERSVGKHGRIILRYSGTEPKIRVFVEANDLAPHQAKIDRLVLAIEETLQ